MIHTFFKRFSIFQRYTLKGILELCYFKIRTFFVLRNARLIRFPFRIRGGKFIKIDKGFTTGYNCRIDAFNHYDYGGYLIEIGRNVSIGDDVHIGAVEKVTIGDDVLIASKVYITDHNHGNYRDGEIQDIPLSIPNSRKIYTAPTHIKKNVWIGEMVCVLQGVTIGEGSIIGAMSLVNKDIPPYCIAVGSPCTIIKRFNFETQQWEKVKE